MEKSFDLEAVSKIAAQTTETRRSNHQHAEAYVGVRNVHTMPPAVPAYVLLRSWRASDLRARRLAQHETISPIPLPWVRRDLSPPITIWHFPATFIRDQSPETTLRAAGEERQLATSLG